MVVVGFATPAIRATTGNAGCLTCVLCAHIVTLMLILDRDRQIVMSIARFGQLTASHLRTMHFQQHASQTPLDRALKRLVESRFIARIERRMIGGSGAGSGQYVYQLGSAGWTLAGRAGRYWPARTVNYHTLAIADAYRELLELEHKGRIEIVGFTTEPETWRTVGGVELRPDMFIQIGNVFKGTLTSLWLEVDMGTERQKQIKDKLALYWQARQRTDASELAVFPRVIFVAPDEHRATELRWIVEQGPEEAQDLFLISTADEFAALIFS